MTSGSQPKAQEVEAFKEHITSVNGNIKFTREDSKDSKIPFMACSVQIEKDGNLKIEA